MSDDRERGSKLEFDPPNSSAPHPEERETVRPQAEQRQSGGEGLPPRGEPRRSAQAGASDSNKPMILSILYLTSLIVGLTGLVAFILALIWKSEPGEPWEASHYEYHIMTFLLWLGATIVSLILIFTIIGALIGIPLLILAYVWVLVRAIMSLVRASNREPMPNPSTLLA